MNSTNTRIMKGRIGKKTKHAFLVAEVASKSTYFKHKDLEIDKSIGLLRSKVVCRKIGTQYDTAVTPIRVAKVTQGVKLAVIHSKGNDDCPGSNSNTTKQNSVFII